MISNVYGVVALRFIYRELGLVEPSVKLQANLPGLIDK